MKIIYFVQVMVAISLVMVMVMVMQSSVNECGEKFLLLMVGGVVLKQLFLLSFLEKQRGVLCSFEVLPKILSNGIELGMASACYLF